MSEAVAPGIKPPGCLSSAVVRMLGGLFRFGRCASDGRGPEDGAPRLLKHRAAQPRLCFRCRWCALPDTTRPWRRRVLAERPEGALSRRKARECRGALRDNRPRLLSDNPPRAPRPRFELPLRSGLPECRRRRRRSCRPLAAPSPQAKPWFESRSPPSRRTRRTNSLPVKIIVQMCTPQDLYQCIMGWTLRWFLSSWIFSSRFVASLGFGKWVSHSGFASWPSVAIYRVEYGKIE